jgi:DNA-binding transcriptional LysR family regulator
MDHVSRIDLNLLVVLEAIYGEGGVSNAGQKLHLTQPAVSHALARLRGLFHDPLFVRDGRTLAPTPFTRRLIEPLRSALRSLNAALGNTERFDAGETQAQFTVAIREPAEILALPSIMRRVASGAPRIDVRVVPIRRRMIEAALSSGALDLAIDVLLPLSATIRRQQLATDRLVVVARKGHPLIRRGFTLATYMKQDHVVVTSRRKGSSLEDLPLGQRGLRRRIRLRCRNYAAALRVVSQTDLILTMAERYARLLGASVTNQLLPAPIKMPTLDSYLYWHEAVDDAAGNRWLRGLVTQAFSARATRPS